MYLDYKSYVLFALALALAGYLIKYRNATYLVPGYDRSKIQDVAGLKNWIGSRAMLMGLVLAGLGFFFNYPRQQTVFSFAFFLAILAINTIAGSKRFLK